MEKFKQFILKIIYGFPIALFLGIGALVVTDVIQPSYFRDILSYGGYFTFALFVGFIALLGASNLLTLITNGNAKKNARPFSLNALIPMLTFLFVEGLFSFLAVQSYYGDMHMPTAQILGICGIPFLFSFFYFPSLIITTYNNYQEESSVKLLTSVEDVKPISPHLLNEYQNLVNRKKQILDEKENLNG